MLLYSVRQLVDPSDVGHAVRPTVLATVHLNSATGHHTRSTQRGERNVIFLAANTD